MTEQLRVAVSFNPSCGYVSEASHRCPRSITALSLDGLRKRILVMLLSRSRQDRTISVQLDLDPSAAQEAARRVAGEGRPEG